MTSPPYIHFAGLHMECHALIPHPSEPAVCMVAEDGRWALPRFTSREHFTPLIATELNQAIQGRFGLNTRLLRQVYSHHIPGSNETHLVLVMDNRSPAWVPPGGARWVDGATAARLPLSRSSHGPVLRAWFDEADGANIPTLRPPWERPQWHDAADAWILRQFARLGITPAGPVEQVKSWAISCILRIPTTGGMVYFKASPEVFAHEGPLTAALARLYPDISPCVLATDTERHWMLMEDIGGTPLRSVGEVSRWATALRSYAETQVQLASHQQELGASGCPLRTLDSLAGEIDPLLSDTFALSLGGAEPGLTVAEVARLRALGPHLKAACRALAAYRVPLTLTHGDFVAVNIVARPSGYVFFDWMYSSIAHPFFDLSFVMPKPTEGGPSDFFAIAFTPATRATLTDAYLAPWTAYEPMPRLRQMLTLAEPLGTLHYALTFHRYIVPSVKDAAEWRSSVPRLLRAVLQHERTLSANR